MRCWAVLAATLCLLVACSKNKNPEAPAKLASIKSTLRVDHIWSASLADRAARRLRLGLGLALDGSRVFASGHKGQVEAFDLASGRRIWRTNTKLPLGGGPAVRGNLVVVGASDGHVVALNAADGKPLWTVLINGAVISAPAISDNVVAVRSVDGKLRALSPTDGHELWESGQEVPSLSLRGASSPVIVGDLIICGFDNGKVVAVNSGDGSQVWQATVAAPHGRTEIERLADVDGPVDVADKDVYAVGFHGNVTMLALESGQTWWAHKDSSFRGLTLGNDAVYMSTADGQVLALNRTNGAVIWRQPALSYRGLTAVAVSDDAVIVADFQGYVHFLDKHTGAFIARARSGRLRISNPPIVEGNEVVVINDGGHIAAYRMSPRT
ncbi:MAG TPA: outer membrane protein assembly factor BamB [Steroidobacteraceae bacterium]|jgi:outer membrane protein assembly factor BamB|nr:outer membrane protein assembly factor BamB [Steroidobacteraceae bacterium]